MNDDIPTEEIRVTLGNKSGRNRNRNVEGAIRFLDGFCFARYSDKQFSKNLAKQGAKLGENIVYDEKKDLVIQQFPGKSAVDIKKIIINEMKNNGGKEVKSKKK